MATINHAKQLTGLTLNGEWEVLDQIKIGHDLTNGTGGFFSVAYNVINKQGHKAFLKALDFSEILAPRHHNPLERLKELTEDYLFEVAVLDKIKNNRMDRVVLSLATGEIYIDKTNPLSIVPFIIFELAEGDVRKFLNITDISELAWKLRILQHVSTGLSQLHRQGISHQDLKPSNILLFNERKISKIGDVGRAVDRSLASNHDAFAVAGAKPYAPPEGKYQFIPPEWKERRLGCDFYHLGSLLCFLFTGFTFNLFLYKNLHPDHSPESWTNSFAEVLPYLRNAFDLAIGEFESNITNEDLKKELSIVLRQLCEPDVNLRGHPLNRSKNGNSFSLERYRSLFDKLEKRAIIGKYKSGD